MNPNLNREPSATDAALRAALQLDEGRRAGDVPEFSCVAARIRQEPSPLDARRWPVFRGMRIAVQLAAAQVRVAAHAVLPAALMTAAAAVAAGCLVPSVGGDAAAQWWFAAFLLLGVALSITAALSSRRSDLLALATPLGPQVVALARLAVVLCVDALAGVAASAAFAALGSLELGAVVASWLVPLALVAGVAAFAAVWLQAPWAGAATGAVLVPFVLPAAQAASAGGAWGLVGIVRDALGPAGLAVLGAALLAAAVCSSGRAALARLQASVS